MEIQVGQSGMNYEWAAWTANPKDPTITKNMKDQKLKTTTRKPDRQWDRLLNIGTITIIKVS